MKVWMFFLCIYKGNQTEKTLRKNAHCSSLQNISGTKPGTPSAVLVRSLLTLIIGGQSPYQEGDWMAQLMG